MVLGRSEIDYRSAGRIGETLVTGARIARFGTSSVIFELQTWEQASGRVVIDARFVYVVVDHETFRPKAVPQFFIEAVEKAQGAPVERAPVKA
jgi:acyl-CoA thioesterase FadM